MLSYKKTGGGSWVICGPTSELRPGPVTVTKANGEEKTETVVALGKAFKTDTGLELVYGYLAPKPDRQAAGRGRRGARTGCSCGSREDESRASDCRSCRFDNEDN